MIVKIPPRSQAVKAAGTRTSLFALMAYLLGRGDKDKPQVFTAAEMEGQAEASGNRHEQPRVVGGGGSEVVVHGAVLATSGIDWSRGDEAACWGEEARLASKLAASMCDLAPGSQAGANAVWHGILALHPRDGTLTQEQWDSLRAERGAAGRGWPDTPLAGDLTDEQWAQIAARAMKETGYDLGDGNGVQWVAVRHGRNDAGADHIHIAAVLIRPDGSRPSRHNDALKLHRVAAWAEREFGLIPQPRGAEAAPRVRLDKDAERSEVEHEKKRHGTAGSPYPKPEGISDGEWAQLRQRLRPSAWTRQGRTRSAVLSAAARAISRDHLQALLEDQGYRVTWRYSTQDPEQVTGWSITAPAHSDGRRWGKPKSYRGGALGKDCTWPAVHKRIEHRNVSLGLGIVAGEGGDEEMLSRDRMIAAGWGAPFIAEVIAKDLQLATRDGDQAELTAVAYWLRDAFWQIAWREEGSRGGVWTDAAYLYAAIAVDGPPPPPPQELLDLITEQEARIAQARANKQHVLTRIEERDRTERAWLDWSEAWHQSVAWARHDEPVPVPLPDRSPAASTLRGASLIRLGHYTARQREAAAALKQASQAHEQARAVFRQLGQAAKMDHVWVQQQNAAIAEAKARRQQAEQLLEQYRQAERDWRDRMGRLLVDARQHGEAGTDQVVDATDRIQQHLAATAPVESRR